MFCLQYGGGGLDFGRRQMKEEAMKAHKGPSSFCRIEVLLKIKAQGFCLLLIKTFRMFAELKILATSFLFLMF
jgi:hypothetical protein